MDCEQHLLPALLEALNDDPRNYGVRGKLVAAIGELGFRNHAMTAALSVSGHLIKQGHILPALFVLCESKSYNGFSSPRIQERLQFLHGESVLSEQRLLEDTFEHGDLNRKPIEDLDPDTIRSLTVEEQVAAVVEFLEEPAIHSARGIAVPMPLFSEMNCQQFMTAVPDLTYHHVEKETAIISAGDVADSVLVIVSGEANVMREGERIARLGSGSVVGEMALLNKSIRKVDVVATSALSYLELKGADALAWCEESPEFEEELRRFCNNRMIQNLIRTSDLFSHFDVATASMLAQSFVQETFQGGDILVSYGAAGQGLWLIAHGQVEVQIPTAETAMSKVATLGEGEIFGEISLLTALPTTAQLLAKTDGWALFLDKSDFEELLDDHPEVAEYVKELGEQRVAEQAQIAKS